MIKNPFTRITLTASLLLAFQLSLGAEVMPRWAPGIEGQRKADLGNYHMIVSQGGTAGPPTSHMVVSARSKSIDGPWENSPYNPIVRTASRDDNWWSRGHGTLVDGPDAQWYLGYHANSGEKTSAAV